MSGEESVSADTPKQMVVKVHKCPICGKLTDSAKYRPFCCKRCADIDLGNWFGEGYVIEGKAPIDEEESE